MPYYNVSDDLLDALIQQESGGNNGAVSSAGARGLTQVMPMTGRDPGFGVQPLRDNSEAEYRRFGRDYLGAMLNRYNGDTAKALAAYNAGPGTVDKAGGVPNIPETQSYVKNIMGALNPISNVHAEGAPNPQEWLKQHRASQDQQTQPPNPQEWLKQHRASQPSKNFGERLTADLNAIPRQTGLAARYAIEGVSGIPDIVAQPFIAGVNAVLPTDKQQMNFGQMGSAFADKLGLPQPENSTERIIGDASRMLAGGGALVKGAGMAKEALTGGAKAIASALSYRPELQAASAVGSGLAGGYTRETGGTPAAQVVASVAGGLAAPAAVGLGMGAVNAVRGLRVDPRQVSITIQTALNDSGIRMQDVPTQIMSSLEDDVAKAMSIGNVSGDALKRLIDYRLVGATPGRGNLTLTPGDITQQKNAAKIGINSSNPRLQALANQQNENTGIFISRLNELGAGDAVDAYKAGNKLIGAIKKPIATAKGEIGSAYDAARSTNGVDSLIDARVFKETSDKLLKDNLLNKLLPKDIRSRINEFAREENPNPLTVSEAEQFKTIIGDIQRNSNKGNVRKAIGFVRQALDDAPLLEGQGQESIDAFNNARGLNREWMQKVEKTPALKAVLDEASPDDFIERQVINADVQDLARLKNTVKGNAEAVGTIKAQIIRHLKRAAVGVNPDEARVFTQSGLNRAIDDIGEQKLRMFLSSDELSQLKALGRVARYEQVQPVGSAVNNSNTAGSVINFFDDLLKKLPFGKQAVSDPLEYYLNARKGAQISNVPNALTYQTPKNRMLPAPMLLIPGQIGDY